MESSSTERMADPAIVRALGLDRRAHVLRVAGAAVKWALLAATVFGVGSAIQHARRPPPEPEMVSAPVTRGELSVAVSATGTVQALNSVEVGAEVTGRILELHAEDNDHVKRGQLLALIDPEQLHAAADQAQAQLAAARAAVRQARATVTQYRLLAIRTASLADQRLVSAQALEQAQADAARADSALDNATANATLAEAALVSARSHLDKAKITSPIDGIVLARLVEPGQTVTAGFSTPILFRIAEDLTQMRLHVDVDEADVGRVREGNTATFTVEAYPDRVFSSRVISLRNDPKTSQNVVTYEALLAVDNSELLIRPGMTATATITTEVDPDVVLVPDAALRFVPPGAKAELGKPGWRWVWTQSAIGVTTPIAIRPGSSDGVHTAVLEGALAVGTPVLVDLKDPL